MSNPFRGRKYYPSQEYDGTTIEHMLDYYFPEWSSDNTKLPMLIAHGHDSDNNEFCTYITEDGGHVVRLNIAQIVPDAAPDAHVMLQTSIPKLDIAKLWQVGDVFSKKTDTRFMIMKRDREDT